MQKLNDDQKAFANYQKKEIQQKIKQLQKSIIDEQAGSIKKQFITQQIKQLNVVKQQLQNMLKDED